MEADESSEDEPNSQIRNEQQQLTIGPDHVQVNWKHKSIGNISQLETRPLIG